MSLGYQDRLTESPKLHEIKYEKGDGFVMVTDGFTDQIGGKESGHSFGYRRLIAALEKVKHLSASEITKSLRSELAVWQGPQKRRDDVTLVAFRLG